MKFKVPNEFLRKYRIVIEIFNRRKVLAGKFYANILFISYVAFLFCKK